MDRRTVIQSSVLGGTGLLGTGVTTSVTASSEQNNTIGKPIFVDLETYRNHDPTRKIIDGDAIIAETQGDQIKVRLNREYIETEHGDQIDYDGKLSAQDVYEAIEQQLEEDRSERATESGLDRPSEQSGNSLAIQSHSTAIDVGRDARGISTDHLERSINVPWTIRSVYGHGISRDSDVPATTHFEALPTGGAGTMHMRALRYVTVDISGDSPAYAGISMSSTRQGYLFSVGSGISLDMKLVVIDTTTGTKSSQEIYSVSGHAFNRNVSSTRRTYIERRLRPGRSYRIGLEVDLSISVLGGGASVDFGHIRFDRRGSNETSDHLSSGSVRVEWE